MKRKIYTIILAILILLSFSQPLQVVRFYSGDNQVGIVILEFFGIDNAGVFVCPATMKDNTIYYNPLLPVIPDFLIVDC